MEKISFIIPTRNNLPYLKLAYGSIRKFYPNEEIIIMDDGSSDGTLEWATTTQDPHTLYQRSIGRQLGHTVLYDLGVNLASNEIFTIFHADMVCGPNYVENILKHLKPGGVVAATRIEPPLHPPGKEKIIKDFGIYSKDFKENDFEIFCLMNQTESVNPLSGKTTKGIFAPWAMYKKDFQAIGGHDKFFAPFPYEDSDIFQRFILVGYDIKQSRDAFVYHFTCRGHRWTEEVQKDDHFYKLCCVKNISHFIRKWGSWIQNDENCFPVIKPLYDMGFVVKNCSQQLLGMLEPWCSTIYCDANIIEYINQVQPGTPFDMKQRVKKLGETPHNLITVSFDGAKVSDIQFLTKLPEILADSGEIGEMEFNDFKLDIKSLASFEKELVNNDSSFYKGTIRQLPPSDPYCLDELFKVFSTTKAKQS